MQSLYDVGVYTSEQNFYVHELCNVHKLLFPLNRLHAASVP